MKKLNDIIHDFQMNLKHHKLHPESVKALLVTDSGITLVSVMVTVIVMLIIASITIAIGTDSKIISQTGKAADRYIVQEEEEALADAFTRTLYDEEINGVQVNEQSLQKWLDKTSYNTLVEEQVKEYESFFTVTFLDTGNVHQINIDTGKIEFKDIIIDKDLDTEIKDDTKVETANIQFDPQPRSDTNGNVYTTITTNYDLTSNIYLQYSKDGIHYINYTTPVESTKNETIYARIYNQQKRTKLAYGSTSFGNIDKLAPIGTFAITEKTSNRVKIVVTADDAPATADYKYTGIKGYYYSKDDGATWSSIQTDTNSNIYEFKGLDQTDQRVYRVKIEDNVGNICEDIVQTSTTKTVSKPRLSITSSTNWEYQKTVTITADNKDNISNTDGTYYTTIVYTTDGSTPTVRWDGSKTVAVNGIEATSGVPFTLGTQNGNSLNSDYTIKVIAFDDRNTNDNRNGPQAGETATLTVSTHDTQRPTGTEVAITNAESNRVTTYSITPKMTITDNLSGLQKVDWYYKKDGDSNWSSAVTDTYNSNGTLGGTALTSQGTTIGVRSATLTHTFGTTSSPLTQGTKYNWKAVIWDVAGNNSVDVTGDLTTKYVTEPVENNGEITIAVDSSTNWHYTKAVTLTANPVTTLPNWTEYSTLRWKIGSAPTSETDGHASGDTVGTQNGDQLNSNYVIYANAFDTVHQKSIKWASLTVTTQDTKAPSATTTGSVNTYSITPSVTVSDNLSGLSKIDWYYKQNGASSWSAAATDPYTTYQGTGTGDTSVTKTHTFGSTSSPLTQGTTYNWYARIWDVSGNYYDTPSASLTTKDVTQANETTETTGEIKISANSSTNWEYQKAITVTASPNGTEYSQLRWKVGGAPSSSTDGTACTSGTAFNVGTQNGDNYNSNYTIYVTGFDAANQKGKGYASLTITTQDTKAPSATTTGSVNTYSITPSVTVSDNLSGLSKIDWYYKQNGASTWNTATDPYTTYQGTGTGSTSVTKTHTFGSTSSPLTQGTIYNWYARIWDVSGNYYDTPSANLTTNNVTEPTLNNGEITIAVDSSTSWQYTKTVTITANNSNYTTLKWRKDAAPDATNGTVITSGTAFNLGSQNANDYNSNYTIYARAIDAAGQLGKSWATLTVTTHDTRAPVISSWEIKNLTSTGYDVYVYGVDDSGCGVDRVQFPTWTQNNGQDDIQTNWSTSSTATGTKDGTTWVYRVNVADHKKESGQYHTHFYAYDKIGNYAVNGFDNVQVPNVTARFNGNGGTDGTSITTSYSSTLGTLPSSSRTGYTFAGWYTAASGGSQISSSTTMPAGTQQSNGTYVVDYYAHWIANSYTIAYNNNGGSGSVTDTSARYDSSYTLPGSGCGMTKTGYYLSGWRLNNASTGTFYNLDASVSNLTSTNGGTVTMYAQWTAISGSISISEGSWSWSSGAAYTTATISVSNKQSGYSLYYKAGNGGWSSTPNSSATISSVASGTTVYAYVGNGTHAQSTSSRRVSHDHSFTIDTGVQYSAATETAYRYNYTKCACGYDPRSSAHTVKVADTTIPTVSIVTSSATSAHNYSITVTANDIGGSGLSTAYLYNNGTGTGTQLASASFSSGQATLTLSNTTFGTMNYSVKVKDGAGNYSSYYSLTINDTYISNETELARFRDGVNSGSYRSWSVTQTADITLLSSWSTGIGNSSYTFAGTYNGNSKKITGLTISSSNSNIGFIGYNDTSGTIQNLTFYNISVTGGYTVGGVVGYNKGTISNCSIVYNGTGKVSGTAYVGGIAGETYGPITNCSVGGSCSVKGSTDSYNEASTGGICGILHGGGSIANCTNSAGVQAGGANIGGIVGLVKAATCSIDNCENNGTISGSSLAYVGGIVGLRNGNSASKPLTITKCRNKGTVNGGSSVGGILGGVAGNGGTTVDQSYNKGAITSNAKTGTSDSSTHCGGVVGYLGDSNTVQYCYNTGAVKTTLSGASCVGGVVGTMESGTTVQQCYSSGKASSTQSSYTYIGGVVGRNNSGTLIDNFCLDSNNSYAIGANNKNGSNLSSSAFAISDGTGSRLLGYFNDAYWNFNQTSWPTLKNNT